MGYTKFTCDLIERYINGIESVLDFGSSNLYLTNDPKPPFVDVWFKSKGVFDYTCIDLAGDNNALMLDAAYPIKVDRQFSLVVDAGFSEHVVQMSDYETLSFHEGHIHSIYPKGEIKNTIEGFYNCWLNKFNLCKTGGLIISENPMTGHWPEHGYHYITPNFYVGLRAFGGVELIDVGVSAAMGNEETGKNVYGVVRKTSDEFPDIDKFKTFTIFNR